jgi:hypothetical protein
MPNNSTTCQLIALYHQITEVLDKGLECRLVFCDFSKAFDKLWHKGAIHKSKKAGISGKLLRWYEDYLNNCKQKVVINGESSPLLHLETGVPQGLYSVR